MSDYDEDKDCYDAGFDDGYAAGESSTIKVYEEKIEDIERDNEKALERAYKDGYSEAEEIYERRIDTIQYNIEAMIDKFTDIIQDLRKQNYELRKENAAITRSVQKST